MNKPVTDPPPAEPSDATERPTPEIADSEESGSADSDSDPQSPNQKRKMKHAIDDFLKSNRPRGPKTSDGWAQAQVADRRRSASPRTLAPVAASWRSGLGPVEDTLRLVQRGDLAHEQGRGKSDGD